MATNFISGPSRSRLIGCLKMLASPIEGEVQGAGFAIQRIVQSLDLDWDVLIPASPQQRQPPPLPKQRRHKTKTPSSWLSDAEACLQHRARLTAWELGFVESLIHREVAPSEKQAAILAQILLKVQR